MWKTIVDGPNLHENLSMMVNGRMDSIYASFKEIGKIFTNSHKNNFKMKDNLK